MNNARQQWSQAYRDARQFIKNSPYPPSWLKEDEGLLGAAYMVRCLMYQQPTLAALQSARRLIAAGKRVIRLCPATGRDRLAQGRREYWKSPSLRRWINLP